MDEWIEKFILNKKRIAIATTSVLAGTVLVIGHFSSDSDAKTYAKAEAAFAKWQASPENEKLYAAMQNAINAIPSLKRKYEPLIAQRLIDTKHLNEALVIAEKSLNRVKDAAPFHSAYAEISLLIEKGNFQEALERSVALKEKIGVIPKGRAGAMLYAYNLLRIASLQQELNNRPGEKAGWEELESYLKANQDVLDCFAKSIAKDAFLFTRYIEERKQQL
jgi:hypothetical protein